VAWIGFDWDGTLQKLGTADEPTDLVPFAKWLIEKGAEVRILTTRVNSKVPDQWVMIHKKHIEALCQKWFGCKLPIQSEKDNDLVLFYDDLAVSVEKNTGRVAMANRLEWNPQPLEDIYPKRVE
jgi:hypothetical protein